MKTETGKKIQHFWPYIAYLFLVVLVFLTTDFDQQFLVLAFVMLLLPMMDGDWKVSKIWLDNKQAILCGFLGFIAAAVISLKPDLLPFFFATLVFSALPEEWFFRSYLMKKMGSGIKANVATSICFSVLHAITLGWVSSLLVFIPSLVFGWIYQKQGNIVTLIFIHAISNLVYVAYLHLYFEKLY